MQSEIEKMEKEVRLSKLQAALGEFRLNRLKLMQKVANIEKEMEIQTQAINKLTDELGE